MTMTTEPNTLCRTCATPIHFIDCPTGGWWAHRQHPADEHDAVPGAWVDGDELMEAIAAEVWEHCASEGTSLIVDDPRNIAGTAAAAARRMPPAAGLGVSATPSHTDLRQRIARALVRYDWNAGLSGRDTPSEHHYGEADAVLAVLPPPADRAAVLADDEGDELVCVDQCGSCDACGMEPFGTPAEGWRQAAHFLRRTARESGDRAGALHGARLIEAELRRLADEAQQPDTEDGDEQADGPTWSDTCPHCKRWYTTSEPGAHEAACPMRPGAEAQQQEPDETDASEADIDRMLAVGVPVQVVTRPPDTHAAAPQPEPPVHGESVAHLAGLHDDEPAVDARQPDVQVWPLNRILTEVRCGSQDWPWEEEWADLDRRHAETGYLVALEQQIRENGITMPVLIGSDGRLWDGHHRLRIAVRVGIPYVPVEIVSPTEPAVDARQDGAQDRG